jgi:mitosis inhibitor protein kinase SWE1
VAKRLSRGRVSLPAVLDPPSAAPDDETSEGKFELEFAEVGEVGSGEFGKVMKVRRKGGSGGPEGEAWAVKKSKGFEGPRHR